MYENRKWLIILVAAVGYWGMATGCGPQYPKCDTDQDCQTEEGKKEGNLYCLEGRCQECRTDDHCDGPGMRCNSGACEEIPGYCESDADCTGSQVCRDNRCGPECRSDDECGEDQVCEGGSCVADQECTTDADCASGETCQDGECIIQQTTGTCTVETVYFPFDSSELTSETRNTLQNNADCIEQKENRTVELAGHCDERGTNEYNIALGRRRAQSVYDYMKSLGISSSRLETISYGEERLARQCGVDGPEDCHEKNRRVEFNLQ